MVVVIPDKYGSDVIPPIYIIHDDRFISYDKTRQSTIPVQDVIAELDGIGSRAEILARAMSTIHQ